MTRLLAAALAASPVVGLTAVTAPAALAAPAAAVRPAAHADALAPHKFLSPDINFSCPTSFYHGGPFSKVVNATGIHIWSNIPGQSPKVLYGIAKGATFKSSWITSTGTSVGCESPIESANGSVPAQHWVLGWDVSDPSHTGWVGLKYLNS